MKRAVKSVLTIAIIICVMLFVNGAAQAATLRIPAGTKVIEEEAFYGDHSIDEVILPDGIEEIGPRAFANSGLLRINMPDSLTTVSDDAFDSVYHLNMNIPEAGAGYDWAVKHHLIAPHGNATSGIFHLNGSSETLSTNTIIEYDISQGDFQFTCDVLTQRLLLQQHINGFESVIYYAYSLNEKPNFTDDTQIKRRTGNVFGLMECDALLFTRLALQAYINESGLIRLSKEELEQAPYCVLHIGFARDGETAPSEWGSYAIHAYDGTKENHTGEFYFRANSDNKTATLIEYTGQEAHVIIPQTDEYDRRVTKIGNKAFNGNSSLEELTIPEGITSIQREAFSNCELLEKVSFPESLMYIGPKAFYGNPKLTSIDLPSEIRHILEEAFAETGLTEISLPDTLVEIASNAFDKGISILANPEKYTYEWAVTNSFIEESTSEDFEYKTQYNYIIITKYKGNNADVAIPKYLKGKPVVSIADGAFANNKVVKRVIIPETVTSIGSSAFLNSSLSYISLPRTLTKIEGACFSRTELKSVVIPDGVTCIARAAFSDCFNLTSITLPESLTRIEDSAFSYCKGLSKIELPKSLTHLGIGAFEACEKLESICIPDGVKKLPHSCFRYCYALKNVVLSQELEEIMAVAFCSCDSLENIIIPEKVKSIEDWAFESCNKVKIIVIPPSVSSIGENAFDGTLFRAEKIYCQPNGCAWNLAMRSPEASKHLHPWNEYLSLGENAIGVHEEGSPSDDDFGIPEIISHKDGDAFYYDNMNISWKVLQGADQYMIYLGSDEAGIDPIVLEDISGDWDDITTAQYNALANISNHQYQVRNILKDSNFFKQDFISAKIQEGSRLDLRIVVAAYCDERLISSDAVHVWLIPSKKAEEKGVSEEITIENIEIGRHEIRLSAAVADPYTDFEIAVCHYDSNENESWETVDMVIPKAEAYVHYIMSDMNKRVSFRIKAFYLNNNNEKVYDPYVKFTNRMKCNSFERIGDEDIHISGAGISNSAVRLSWTSQMVPEDLNTTTWYWEIYRSDDEAFDTPECIDYYPFQNRKYLDLKCKADRMNYYCILLTNTQFGEVISYSNVFAIYPVEKPNFEIRGYKVADRSDAVSIMWDGMVPEGLKAEIYYTNNFGSFTLLKDGLTTEGGCLAENMPSDGILSFRLRYYKDLPNGIRATSEWSDDVTVRMQPVGVFRSLILAWEEFKTADSWKGGLDACKNDLEGIFKKMTPEGLPWGEHYGYKGLSLSETRDRIMDMARLAGNSDITWIHFSTHGSTSANSNASGELLIAKKYDNDVISETNLELSTLADWLNNIPGRVIVSFGSCGSGAAVFDAAVYAIGGVDTTIEVENGVTYKTDHFTGILRQGKFIVLTASTVGESSIYTRRDGRNMLLKYISEGVGEADGFVTGRKDGIIQLNEMGLFLKSKSGDEHGKNEDGTEWTVHQTFLFYPNDRYFELFKTVSDD